MQVKTTWKHTWTFNYSHVCLQEKIHHRRVHHNCRVQSRVQYYPVKTLIKPRDLQATYKIYRSQTVHNNLWLRAHPNVQECLYVLIKCHLSMSHQSNHINTHMSNYYYNSHNILNLKGYLHWKNENIHVFKVIL